MEVLFINGSPRGKASNTDILFKKIGEGMRSINSGIEIKEVFLAVHSKLDQHLKEFNARETVIIGFPLYTDAMPGIVMQFIEQLDIKEGKKVGFVIQSGFPESIHSLFIAEYLEKLSNKLGWLHLGTVIRGGVEGIRIMPDFMTRKLFKSFYILGQSLALTGKFDSFELDKLKKPEKLSFMRIGILKIMQMLGVANIYWDNQLRKNKAYKNRFAAPYAKTK